MTGLELRVLVHLDSALRSLSKIVFSRNDASFYLIPYCVGGTYYFGSNSMAEQQAQATFDFTIQESAVRAPKLSIHETGQVHVRVGALTAGPLQIPPLTDLRGQHVATVCADTIKDLVKFISKGPVRDCLILQPDAGTLSVRLAVYVNAIKPLFAASCPRWKKLPTKGSSTVYVGFAPQAQDPLGGGSSKPGVTVIGGWDPTLPPGSKQDFLFLRGQ